MAGFDSFAVVLFLGLALNSSQILAQDPYFMIESPKVTDWGSWGELEVCPAGSFVFGFRLKVEPYQTVVSDDCSLSAVELLCISPMMARRPASPLTRSNHSGLLSKAFATVVSKMGHRGEWGPIKECAEPEFVVGFNLKAEGDQGWFADDTAANDLKLICSGGQTIETGNGMSYGDWSTDIKCPRGHYVCGIQTQVEDEQDVDDTTLNNVRHACCPIPA